jgi:hypothetical protein
MHHDFINTIDITLSVHHVRDEWKSERAEWSGLLSLEMTQVIITVKKAWTSFSSNLL